MKKQKILKICILLIVIIIPLIAAGIVGNYSTNRYTNDKKTETLQNFVNQELLSGLNTTEERMELNIKLRNYYYNTKPIYSTEYKNEDGEVLFKFDLYQTLSIVQSSSTEEEKYTAKYDMYAYNVNYTLLKEMFNGKVQNKEQLEKNAGPKLVINFYPTEELKEEQQLLKDNESGETYNGYVLTYDVSNQEIPVMDYNSQPEKRADNEEYYRVQHDIFREAQMEKESKNAFKNGIGYITISATFAYTDDDGVAYVYNLNENLIDGEKIENFYISGEDLKVEDFEKGYLSASNDDKYAALGFDSWVFKKYVWWQALIAYVVAALIMTGFYFAFTYEEENVKAKGKKNKKQVANAKKK